MTPGAPAPCASAAGREPRHVPSMFPPQSGRESGFQSRTASESPPIGPASQTRSGCVPPCRLLFSARLFFPEKSGESTRSEPPGTPGCQRKAASFPREVRLFHGRKRFRSNPDVPRFPVSAAAECGGRRTRRKDGSERAFSHRSRSGWKAKAGNSSCGRTTARAAVPRKLRSSPP